MSKPRLLLVLPEFPPSFGGMQTHAVEIATELHRRGYTLQLLAYQPLNEKDKAAQSLIDEKFEFPVIRKLSRLAYFRNLRIIEKHIRSFNADIVYASTVFYGGCGEKCGIPVICRSPGNDVQRPWIPWPFPILTRLVSSPWFENSLFRIFRKLDYPKVIERFYFQRRRRITTKAACKADLILANSQFTIEHLKAVGVADDHIRLMVGGVDSSRFKNIEKLDRIELSKNRRKRNLPEDSWIILTACRLVHKKGIDFLIRSMQGIIKTHPDAHLVIVGDGPKMKRYRRLIARLELEDQITLTGAIPQNEIQNWYQLANVFVLASRLVIDSKNGACDAETMGRVLCEANAIGIPVIAANSGGIPSLISDMDNGLLFESDDFESFMEAFNKLRQSPDLRAKLVAEGRRRAVELFDWNVLANQHEQVFRNALNQTTAHKKAPEQTSKNCNSSEYV